MAEDDRELVPCKVEIRNPEYDWETTWHRARLPGLGSELMTLLFKVVHAILVGWHPTYPRESIMNQPNSEWSVQDVPIQ